MKPYIIIFSLILFFANDTISQKSFGSVELSEIRKNDAHLELDIKNIFNGLSNATILYKKKRQNGKWIEVNALKLLRVLGSFNSQINFKENPVTQLSDTTYISYHPSTFINISIGIGLEKQIMHKKFVHSFGFDLIQSFSKNDDSFTRGLGIGFGSLQFDSQGFATFSNSYTYFNTKTSLISFGITPFFGIKYYLNQNISIGIETGFEISGFMTTVTDERYYSSFTNGQVAASTYEESETVKSFGLIANFKNLRYLTVGYAF